MYWGTLDGECSAKAVSRKLMPFHDDCCSGLVQPPLSMQLLTAVTNLESDSHDSPGQITEAVATSSTPDLPPKPLATILLTFVYGLKLSSIRACVMSVFQAGIRMFKRCHNCGGSK
jgi:hypothetical protein